MSSTFSNFKRERGISLEMLQRERASFCDNGGISWFFPSCGEMCEVSLELRWGTQGAFHVVPWQSNLHSSCDRKCGIALQSRHGIRPQHMLKGEYRVISRVVAGHLEFLSSCDGDLTNPLMLPQESQVSILVVRGVSGFLSRRCKGIGPHLELRLDLSLSLQF